MADTAIPLTALALNATTANPAGTAIVHANDHVITLDRSSKSIAIRLTNTTASTKVFTVVAGDSPPAASAGQGDLTVALTDGSSTPQIVWTVLETARFVQDDGVIRITVAASTTGNIAALALPA